MKHRGVFKELTKQRRKIAWSLPLIVGDGVQSKVQTQGWSGGGWENFPKETLH